MCPPLRLAEPDLRPPRREVLNRHGRVPGGAEFVIDPGPGHPYPSRISPAAAILVLLAGGLAGVFLGVVVTLAIVGRSDRARAGRALARAVLDVENRSPGRAELAAWIRSTWPRDELEDRRLRRAAELLENPTPTG